MASAGKKKTTFSKLAREQKLRERRRDKQVKKEAERKPRPLRPSNSKTSKYATTYDRPGSRHRDHRFDR